MRSEEIRKILAHGTNMTERDIERHIKDGVSVYDNTEAGYKDYEQECIAGLNDPEEISEMWRSLETVENDVKSYKIDFVLILDLGKKQIGYTYPIHTLCILYPYCIHTVYTKKKREKESRKKRTKRKSKEQR